MPEINDNEVLIKIACVGICGSDVKLWSTGKCGFDVLTEPIVIGHEGAGTVVKVGSNVSTLSVGDRVAVEPTQPCRTCALCRAGRYNLCPSPHYCSSLGADGNLATYYKHVPDYCHKYPIALAMVASGKINVKPLVTHHFALEDTLKAYEVARQGAGIKVMIHVQPRDTNNKQKF
ncbi:hypothetical protein MSG28_012469 [Choristoneura fumiferana]|uniref:Uncharacterized protein n=1 Tax=Choristoneura fumiferana TaxID=7141 RepID=A0ACC0KDD4_CHOFU|nr:hypothetical protein MSG28_012469 [Choristoneura fumiferana]